MLPTGLLALLREWWRVGRREGVLHVDGWLFPGQHYLKPISRRQLHRIVVEASVAAGIGVAQEGDNYVLWVKTWGEVLRESEARHQFIQDQLKIEVTDEQIDARIKDLAQSVIKI